MNSPRPDIVKLVTFKMLNQCKKQPIEAVYLHWLKLLVTLFKEQKVGATLPRSFDNDLGAVAKRIAVKFKGKPSAEYLWLGIKLEYRRLKTAKLDDLIDVFNSRGFKVELAPITSAQLRAIGLKKLP